MKKRQIGLAKKLVFGMVCVAVITYGTSAFFIFILAPFVSDYIPGWLFDLLTLLLGVIWSGILGYFAARYLTRTLREISKKMAKAAEGHLDIEIAPVHTRDEFEILNDNLRIMINRLKNIVAGIQEHTEGTAKRIDNLNESSNEISHQVKQVTMSIEDIASGAESEANTSMNALERVQEGLELSQSISKSAGQSKKMSDVTVKNLAESSETVQALIRGIHLISESNEKMSEEATELKEHAANIDTVVDTVADIAEKTHMLALNANIEAARAGESGKGFAVVASEIQKLAAQSAKSVDAIRNDVSEMQDSVDKTLKHYDQQVEMSNEEVERAKQTDVQLGMMKDSIYQVAESIDIIQNMAEKQQVCMRDITSDAEQTAAISEQTSAAVREVASSAQKQTEHMSNITKNIHELFDDAKSLRGKVNELKVQS